MHFLLHFLLLRQVRVVFSFNGRESLFNNTFSSFKVI